MGHIGWRSRLSLPLLLVATSLLPTRPSAALEGWIYLRGDTPPAPAEPLVELLAVGDIMPGRGLSDAEGLFDRVAEALGTADWTIGNLEGVVAAAPPTDETYQLLLPASVPATLAETGFDLLSLANNHALDAGPEGLARTVRSLSRVGIDPLTSERAAFHTIDGLTFAFVAWNDLGSPSTTDLLSLVRETAAAADNVIVMVHWGAEYQRHPVSPQKELANELLAAGADIVLGTHPHVVQDIQVVGSGQQDEPARLIAYSLGNFAFDQGWEDTATGLGLRLLFDAHGLRAAEALPLVTAPRPRWMDPDEATELLGRILPLRRIGFDCSPEGCSQIPFPYDSRRGQFESGEIDLTGDGTMEQVRLQAGRAEVVEQGEVAWQSPPAWRVRDLALGDPNEDGRFEMLLAIEKTDLPGPPTSHPFLVGYRSGSYRVLWGGSAVQSPILEVELGDLDSDGAPELVVIEDAEGSSIRQVAVWRWHGWGFSLVWRSPPGEYQDLLISPTGTAQAARLSIVRNR